MAKSADSQPELKTLHEKLEELTECVNEIHELLTELVERLAEAQRYKDY